MENVGYQELIERMNELRCLQGTKLPGSENIPEELKRAMARADVLVKNTITKPAEGSSPDVRNNQTANATLAAQDAHFLSLASMLIKGEADGIDANLDTFSPTVFIDSVVSCLKDSPIYEAHHVLDWTKLDPATNTCFSYVPSYDYILGTFVQGEVEPKTRRPREPKEKRVEVQKKQPENVKTVDKTEDQVEATVQIIFNCLQARFKKNNNQPICYFQFVIDPTSFGYTVENIFHLSFLVKDGFAELNLDDHGLPVLKPRMPKNKGSSDSSSSASKNNQMIISMNMEEWEEARKVFNIKKAMIKLKRTEEETEPQPSTSRGKRGR